MWLWDLEQAAKMHIHHCSHGPHCVAWCHHFPPSPKEEKWQSNYMGQAWLQIRLFHLQWDIKKLVSPDRWENLETLMGSGFFIVIGIKLQIQIRMWYCIWFVVLAPSVLRRCCWSSKNCPCSIQLHCSPHPDRWLSGTAPLRTSGCSQSWIHRFNTNW